MIPALDRLSDHPFTSSKIRDNGRLGACKMLRDFTRNLPLVAFLGSVCIYGASVIQTPLVPPPSPFEDATITPALFVELEELARVVDISYCVGTTGLGIQKPFTCASRCGDFEGFELVTVSAGAPLIAAWRLLTRYLRHGILAFYCQILADIWSCHTRHRRHE